MAVIIAKKYELLEKIGEGAFGAIYMGKNSRTNDKVAIKVESIAGNTKLLKNETKIYQYLAEGAGIPQIKWFGVDEINYYMVLTLLGASLQDYINKFNTFSLSRTLSIGIQVLKRLRFIHEKGLLHRDVKPDNFLFGLNENKSTLYVIDFGLCKKYIDVTGAHIEEKHIGKILGSATFASVNIHNLCEPSRRDDLESLAYMMLYFYFGYLEWNEYQDLEYKNLLQKIRISKMNILQNENIPEQIKKFLEYVRKLAFKETPDYDYLYNVLCDI